MTKTTEKPPSANVWFDLKYWKYTLPIVYISYLAHFVFTFSGITLNIREFNIDDCVKIEGESEFRYCESFVLTNETGVAFAACDPIKLDFNKVMGVNRLAPGEPILSGGIWSVHYDETPARIEQFTIDNKQILKDFHPLGVTLDTHPETGVQSLFAINLPIESSLPSIEIFQVDYKNLQLKHQRTITHPKIYSPNTLHIIKDIRFRDTDGTPSFFFSNDHYFTHPILKKVENFVLFWSNVGFYNARLNDVEKGIKGLSFANGLEGTDEVLFVAETYKRDVKQYRIETIIDAQDIPHVRLSYVNEAHFAMAVDNIQYIPERDLIVVAGHPKPFHFLRYLLTKDKSVEAPSQVDVWNIKTGETKVVVQDNGDFYRGSSTGAIDFETSHLIVSSVIDEGILVCDI